MAAVLLGGQIDFSIYENKVFIYITIPISGNCSEYGLPDFGSQDPKGTKPSLKDLSFKLLPRYSFGDSRRQRVDNHNKNKQHDRGRICLIDMDSFRG